MERAEVNGWLEAYVAAWKSYDPGQIGALFSEDVRYRHYPYDPAFEGREAVVRSWLGENEAEGSLGPRRRRHLRRLVRHGRDRR